MIRTLVATLAVAAVLAVAGAGSAYAQNNDFKAFTGAGCKASKGKQVGDIRTNGASIENRNTGQRRDVDCTPLRDSTFLGGPEVDNVNVFVNQNSAARRTVCLVQVRSLVDGSVIQSLTLATVGSGDQVLGVPFNVISYGNVETTAPNVKCRLGERSLIHGISYEEDEPTGTGADN
jgi:hypothetical protein